MNSEIQNICPICKSYEVKQTPVVGKIDVIYVQCAICGAFDISRTAVSVLERNLSESEIKRFALRHWVYKSSINRNTPILISSQILDEVLPTIELPKANEQFSNLIMYLGDTAKSPEELLEPTIEKLISVIGCNGKPGATYVLDHLNKIGLIDQKYSLPKVFLRLNPQGWDEYGKLNRGVPLGNLVFMAMKYNDQLLDEAYKYFQSAVADTGFELKKLEDVLRAGLIDDQLRIKIRQSKFILADLTHQNLGAYWEAGFAEGLGKQVIYLCEKSHEKSTHFDTNHHTTVFWTLDTIEQDMIKLKATIRETFPGEARF